MDKALKNSEGIFRKKESKMGELANIKKEINGDSYVVKHSNY